MVRDTIVNITPSEISTGVTDDENIIVALKELATWMIAEGIAQPYEFTAIKAQLRIILIGHPEFTAQILDDLSNIKNLSQEELELQIGFYYKRVRSYYNDVGFNKVFSRAYFDLRNNVDGSVNKQNLINTLIEDSREYIEASGDSIESIGAVQATLNVSNEDEFTKAFERAKDTVSNDGMLKTGLQGWNTALGGGLRRGDVIDMDALTGRGKSDTARYMLRTIARYTPPFKFFPNREKNMLLYISCEDSETDTIRKMYSDIVEERDGVNCDISKVDVAEAQRVVKEYFLTNGYHFQIVYCRKHELKVSDIKTIINTYEKAGYEIMMMVVDYLQLLYYQDMPGGNDPTKVKNLIGSIETHTKPRLITFLTLNQLDSKAKEIARFETEIAPFVVGKNMQENCKSITNEVDVEIVCHVQYGSESEDGFAYHQFAVGKNRVSKKVPANEKYAVYRMACDADGKPIGFIVPDFDKECQVRNSSGGRLRSEGGGSMF